MDKITLPKPKTELLDRPVVIRVNSKWLRKLLRTVKRRGDTLSSAARRGLDLYCQEKD